MLIEVLREQKNYQMGIDYLFSNKNSGTIPGGQGDETRTIGNSKDVLFPAE
jgi:hypothetical protein